MTEIENCWVAWDLRGGEGSLREEDVDRCQGRNAAEAALAGEDLGIVDLREEAEVQTVGVADPASCCPSSACSASSC